MMGYECLRRLHIDAGAGFLESQCLWPEMTGHPSPLELISCDLRVLKLPRPKNLKKWKFLSICFQAPPVLEPPRGDRATGLKRDKRPASGRMLPMVHPMVLGWVTGLGDATLATDEDQCGESPPSGTFTSPKHGNEL